ncbi:uncharacterized protein FOMMEDRAFT_20460 [Fomitiporia mediterranea MF3/22]|uniref:uncharacterized protein n=1 Tax=Fomitiporia mediterranea (strain MF3/22) TaxID=694068 RepID=UPI0004409397|nr:uncharacterized protein FOMMEDRAFT_20460 [Fomitiporia mediterranea MF3/22]EJD03346.1 hypothetical protein FOMMEDRAFT_20460 [Fomitiporia mediterranea MF3/22]
MLGLSSSSTNRRNNGAGKSSRKTWRRAFKAVMRSYKFKLPNYDLPLRLRPWFIIFTAIVMFMLAFLSFTNFAQSLPLNNKILHLVCLCLATTVFYFIFDVEEDARRIWIWRHAPLILTAVICFFFGGIVSEIIQSLLPYQEFDMGDIAANLLGSAIGLWTAYYLEKYYRHRREIARLYRPVALDADDASLTESEDEDNTLGTMLLPTHHDRRGTSLPSTPAKGDRIRIGDVWDEREELFGIGDSDSEDENHRGAAASRPPPARSSGASTPQQTAGPKIIVTSS